MTTLSSQIVSNLETMAEDLSRQMDSQQPNPPNPSVTFTQVANPSKKRKTYKKKRAEAVKTGQESGFNMADIQDKLWPHVPIPSCTRPLGLLTLLPGARSVEKTFKEASSNLNQAKLVAMEADLKEGLIYLEPIDRSSATAPASPSAHTNTIDPTETDGNLLDPMLTQ
ncbi:uncharacterized protein MELLADRAFT_115866 [Melampsora larici-populina 98AG31]|uniref:Uncharacterized protein n=1 Tax=Melampsora larici-populina (strain 98AG31 / pathotype 3-4-7) TaxID=747676 RepID=F4RF35_MELLP|nr:uncharacterized protein MELLADRAFT_115866 [Melampsora larici-populina 98AG31]EGG08747.1 hypothetical protein MELLADRAFT_115866 [Melampsora larici-populina 98AG31]